MNDIKGHNSSLKTVWRLNYYEGDELLLTVLHEEIRQHSSSPRTHRKCKIRHKNY